MAANLAHPRAAVNRAQKNFFLLPEFVPFHWLLGVQYIA